MQVLEVIAGLHRIGGVTTFVGGLSNALVDQGVNVTIATFRATGGDDDFIPDSRVNVLAVSDIGIDTFDVIHVHGLWDRDVFWATGKAIKHGIPLIWSPHGMLSPWSLKFKWWKKFLPWHLYLKRRLNRAAVLHVTAFNEADWIRELGFTNRIEVVPLGTELHEYVSASMKLERRVLFVGRIHPVKGIENLLRAWALLRSDKRGRYGFKLCLVGIDDGGYQETLVHLAHDLDIEHEVSFIGPKYEVELAQEYKRSWVSILPSFTENFGGVVIDSLANGCPVIASTNTPWAELPKQRCGWWVDNDPQTLAETILAAMNMSAEERLMMGERGRALVKAAYTWQAVANKMKDVYESVAIY